MANKTGTTPGKAPTSRALSRKEANRIAAAKVYVAAMKKAGEEVPEWVNELAKQALLTTTASPVRAPLESNERRCGEGKP